MDGGHLSIPTASTWKHLVRQSLQKDWRPSHNVKQWKCIPLGVCWCILSAFEMPCLRGLFAGMHVSSLFSACRSGCRVDWTGD